MNVYVESLLCGLMVYWDEEKDAARYYVHLLIGETKKENKIVADRTTSVLTEKTSYHEIALVEVERNIKYHSFTNLGKIDQEAKTTSCTGAWSRPASKETGKNYYIYVEAEDKNGKIINKSECVGGVVYSMVNGYFSLVG